MVEGCDIAAGHRCDDRSSQDPKTPVFVPPRPRNRRRQGKGDSRAGYWCRCTTYLARKVAVASHEAREAKRLVQVVQVAREAHERQLQQLQEQVQALHKLLACAAPAEVHATQVAVASHEAREAKRLVQAVQVAREAHEQQLQQLQEQVQALQKLFAGAAAAKGDGLMATHTHTHTPHPHTPEGARSGSSRGSAEGSSPSTDLECGGSPGGVRAGPHVVDCDLHAAATKIQAAYRGLRRRAYEFGGCIAIGHGQVARLWCIHSGSFMHYVQCALHRRVWWDRLREHYYPCYWEEMSDSEWRSEQWGWHRSVNRQCIFAVRDIDELISQGVCSCEHVLQVRATVTNGMDASFVQRVLDSVFGRRSPAAREASISSHC